MAAQEKDKELFDLLSLFAEEGNIGGTLQILDTLLHLMEMVVKTYTEKEFASDDEKKLHQNRAKEIVNASKKAIGKIMRSCAEIVHAPTPRGKMKTVEKDLLDHLPAGVCVTDVLGKIHYANPKFLKISGLKRSDVGSYNVTSLYSDSSHRRNIIKEMKATRKHRTVKAFKVLMKKSGKDFVVETIERNIEWEGIKDCMLAVIIDRTEASKIERMLQKVVHGKVTMEQMLKSLSSSAKERETLTAAKKELEKEKRLLAGFLDSLVNMVGNIIAIEDSVLDKDIYLDRIHKASNIGLFAILALNTFETKELEFIFKDDTHPISATMIRRELIYGVTLHEVGKIGMGEVVASDGLLVRVEGDVKTDRDPIAVGANLVKSLSGHFGKTVKIMAMAHHKTRDGKGKGFTGGTGHKIKDPRELLAKWFALFYSYVVKRPGREDLLSYNEIVEEKLFMADDFRWEEQGASAYPEKVQKLLGRLRAIFNPATENEKYKLVQDELRKWLKQVRQEQESVAVRLKLRSGG
ncbi:MAG: PAS domain S-box protein [bacterium]|nr:PAS domain S-box protein [bacterium]